MEELSIQLPVQQGEGDRKILYDGGYREGFDLNLICSDVLEGLQNLPDGQVPLIVTSPPYNIGKPYEDSMEFRDYLEWQRQVVGECVRVLRDEGSVCWEVGNHVKDGEVFPLDIFFYDILKSFGLSLRNRIVWHFEHGLHAQRRFSGRYETILWFTKGDTYQFNLDDIRVPQKYPGKQAYKGPNKGKPSANPLGKNPSDVWTVLKSDWENEVWDIPNVKANHPEKTLHSSQFPIELVERLVLALSNKGDVVLDPFVGVGSSMIGALFHDRKAIGIDREKAYTDVAFQRIVQAMKGKLRRRPLGRRIFSPKGTEKVARPPAAWKGSELPGTRPFDEVTDGPEID